MEWVVCFAGNIAKISCEHFIYTPRYKLTETFLVEEMNKVQRL